MKKMKNDNKGFTLVELIVVLVILAILAAILVPALLGYIDEAKASQLELHGKSVYTAAQAVSSKMYAKDARPDDGTGKTMDSTKTNKVYFADEVKKISEIDTFGNTTSTAYVKFGTSTVTTTPLPTTEKRKYYVVEEIIYEEDGKFVQLKNGIWESLTTLPSDADTAYVKVTGKTA